MNPHERIDRWSLDMMREIVARIDADPNRRGLAHAGAIARRWYAQNPNEAVREWLVLLECPWEEVRAYLLDEGDEGQRLRSSAPFCGILSPQERLEVFRRHRAS
ncbi:hypothetical protein IV102_38115 [bacterium]|nr:hypothetical protein [bacterium]